MVQITSSTHVLCVPAIITNESLMNERTLMGCHLWHRNCFSSCL